MRIIQTIGFFALFMIVVVAGSQLISTQRALLDETQSTVLLLGETLALISLGYIMDARKRNRGHLTIPLVWLSVAPVLLAVSYLQLPASREHRAAARVAESEQSLAMYRSRHGKDASCPPLEAELRARQLERSASDTRRNQIHRFNSTFESRISACGALSAIILAIVSAKRASHRPG